MANEYSLSFPMAMTGMQAARRNKKIRVNYCFKSSCEINETLRALCWLKRSLPTFNRLFTHTQLCVFIPSFAEHSSMHLACQLTAASGDALRNEKHFCRLDAH